MYKVCYKASLGGKGDKGGKGYHSGKGKVLCIQIRRMQMGCDDHKPAYPIVPITKEDTDMAMVKRIELGLVTM